MVGWPGFEQGQIFPLKATKSAEISFEMIRACKSQCRCAAGKRRKLAKVEKLKLNQQDENGVWNVAGSNDDTS